MKQEENQVPVQPDEHVIHMWTPFHLNLKQGYDYLHRGLFWRFGYILIKSLAVVVFTVVHPLFLGFRLKGREHVRALDKRGVVSICNHVHFLDCTMSGTVFRNRKQYFLTLQSNLEIPFIRHLVKLLGGVPLPRSLTCLGDCTSALCDALNHHKVVQVYPEGSLQPYHKQIRPFRNGAFAIAYDCGVPVLPMVLTFHRPKGLYRLYKRKPCLHLTVLPPVFPNTDSPKRAEVVRMREECHRCMREYFDANNEC